MNKDNNTKSQTGESLNNKHYKEKESLNAPTTNEKLKTKNKKKEKRKRSRNTETLTN